MSIPLLHLRFLMPARVKPMPDEIKDLRPCDLNDLRETLRQFRASTAANRDQPDAKRSVCINAIAVNVCSGHIDRVARHAPYRGQNPMNVLAFLGGLGAIEGTGLVGLDLGDDYVNCLGRQAQCALIILHGLCMIEQEFRSMREPNRQEVRVRTLTTPTTRVNDEVLDLKEPVQSEIPVSYLLRDQ